MDRLPNSIFESDDSDLEEGPDVTRHKTKIIYQNTFPFIHMEPPDVLYERWCRIDPEVKKFAGHMMHVSVFWWHILFRQQENHSTTAWAVAMGFLDSNVSNDLSLMRLHKIEILEFILDTVEKCLASTDPEWKARKIVSIGTSFKMMQQEGCFVDALKWLELSGNPGINRKLMELGPKKIQLQVLEFIFFEYSRYIQVMSCSKKKMIRELAIQPEEWSIQKSEEMKNKGNIEFQRKKYDLALKWYTKAIKFHTNNHILYGNRAICYIRCEKYLKAMGDGKRAIILQRDWAKGHYRFCDALFLLGAKDKAVNANLVAQSYCSADSEGMRDLQQQYQRFMSEISEGSSKGRAPATSEGERKQKKTEAKKGSSKRAEGACGIDPPAHHGPSQKASEAAPTLCTTESKKTTEEIRNMQDPSGNSTTESYTGASLKVPKDAKSEMGDRKNKKGGQNSSEKHPVRTKHLPTQEKLQSSTSNSEVGSKEQFCTAVQDAHTALADQRCRNAEQAFSLALRIVNSSGTTTLGISELDKALLMYGYATALIEIGQPEELFEAQKQFDKLKRSAVQFRTFQSLVHYGLGKVLLKENRFGDAFQEFSNAMLMVQRQIMPGKLTWPTTKVTVQETQPEFLKGHLKSFIEMCKFPPKPDAICRHQHSQNQVAEIYFTDPDFKGFIRMSCCQSCKVEFHISCWKKFKAVSFTDKNDKDFLQDLCFTPDCTGRICNIVIFDSTGLVKCEFKSSISKKPTQRPRVKQECTSLKKLKSKEDRKLRRKQNRAAVSVTKDETNDLPAENGASKKEKAVIQSSPKDSVVYGDRVLHQIYESRELFNDEICSISSILVCLKPWMDLSKAKAHVSMLTCQTEPKVLRDLVDVLLERKNRVWARIFIQNLSGCVDLKSKLHEWAQQLDSAGLKTAEQFISQVADHLETLDLSSLLEFPPLKDLNEKFRPMQKLLGSGFTVTDYLRQAPPQEMRLFIWTLEEHREHYPSCFTMLDEYFEMDAICLVIKKTEVDDHISSFSKCKSKQRKKKPKEPKSVLVLTGLRGGVLRDEDDFFSEEDSLMLLDSTDPFSVPDHLREEIAEFEEHYVGTGRTSQFSRCLDNNPDPTTESLYDYFAQILEQHGPLEPTDPRLVSELEYFPFEAQQKIEVAGGLELFLRGSLRFVKLNNLIGLMTQAVYLQDALDNDMQALDDITYTTFSADDLDSKGSTHLNPTAKEFLPHNNHSSPSDNISSNNSAAFLSDNVLTGTCPTLPSPYDLRSQNCAFVNETVKRELQGAMYPVYPYTSEKPRSKFVSFYEGLSSKISPTSQTISVGTFREDIQDDVVINTEPYAPYEKNNGDITQMEKNNVKRQKEIQDMKEKLELLQKERDEACLAIEDDVIRIQMEMEVANKELNLFQEKLEEEVRKGQQEKKDQQEMVKALKGENKELTDLLDSYSKQIQAKNVEYEKELNHFLAISNKFETEKMSLEDEIKRYKVLCDKATRRSLAAQVNILQNKRDQGLRGLRNYMSNGKVILQSMAEFSTRYPSEGLYSAIQDWTAFVKDVEEKISVTAMQYEEQIELVKKGTRLSSLPQISVPSTRVPPLVPAYVHLSSIQHPVPHNLPVRHPQPQGPYGVQQHHVRPLAPTPPTHPTDRATHSPSPVYEAAVPSATPVAPVQPQPHAVFERMVDRLSNMFPHYSRTVLSGFIKEVRVINGGMLNNLTYDQVINRAAQLILDHQESSQNFVSGDVLGVREGGVASPTPVDFSRGTATPPPTQAWKNVSSQNRNSNRALNFEDPCIICHDDMAQEDVCVLECRHSFHRECIKSWLKEQSTCPTCREHALLPEDFPMLPGRNRRGHAATSSNS